MSVTVKFVNRRIEEVETDENTVFRDLLEPFELKETQVMILVDGIPAALDAEIPDDVDEVQVVNAAQGG